MENISVKSLSQLPDDLILEVCRKASEGVNGYRWDRQLAALRGTNTDLRRIADELEGAETSRLRGKLLALGCPLPVNTTVGTLRAADDFHRGVGTRVSATFVEIPMYPRNEAIKNIEASRFGPGELDFRTFNLVGAEIYWSTFGREDRDVIFACNSLPGLGSNLEAPKLSSVVHLAEESDGHFGVDRFSGGRFLTTMRERRCCEEGENGVSWAQILVDRLSGEEIFRQRIVSQDDPFAWGHGGDGGMVVGARTTDEVFHVWTRESRSLQPTQLATRLPGFDGRATLMDPASSWVLLLGKQRDFPAEAGSLRLWLAGLKKSEGVGALAWQTYDLPAADPEKLFWMHSPDKKLSALSASFVASTVASRLQPHVEEINIDVMAWELSGLRQLKLTFRPQDARGYASRVLGLELCHNVLAVADSRERITLSLFNLTSGQKFWQSCLVAPAGPLLGGPSQKVMHYFSLSAASWGGFYVADGVRRIGFVQAAATQQSAADPEET